MSQSQKQVKHKKVTGITDLRLDAKNANRGTARGAEMVRTSLEELGAGRSIVVDRDGDVVAGNKTLQAALAMGLDIEVVETTGDRLVVVQRTDLDLDDGDKARKLAYADNQTAAAGLEWDSQQVMDDLAAGLDLGDYFTEKEIEKILPKSVEPEEPGEQKISPELFERHDYLLFYFDNEFDWQVITDIFEVGPVLCGKVGKKTITQKGLGRVISGKELLNRLQENAP